MHRIWDITLKDYRLKFNDYRLKTHIQILKTSEK